MARRGNFLFWACSENCERRLLASSCLSVRLSSWKKSAFTGRILEKSDIRVQKKSVQKFKFLQYWTRMTGTLHADRYTFLIISRSVLLRMRNVSDKSCRESQNTHFVFSNFFRKSCRLWDNVEKYGTAGQGTDGNMAHAHCVLDTRGYRHTLRICNTYCFSSATMIAGTRLNVALYYIAYLVHFYS
jgi:hypothetical protein